MSFRFFSARNRIFLLLILSGIFGVNILAMNKKGGPEQLSMSRSNSESCDFPYERSLVISIDSQSIARGMELQNPVCCDARCGVPLGLQDDFFDNAYVDSVFFARNSQDHFSMVQRLFKSLRGGGEIVFGGPIPECHPLLISTLKAIKNNTEIDIDAAYNACCKSDDRSRKKELNKVGYCRVSLFRMYMLLVGTGFDIIESDEKLVTLTYKNKEELIASHRDFLDFFEPVGSHLEKQKIAQDAVFDCMSKALKKAGLRCSVEDYSGSMSVSYNVFRVIAKKPGNKFSRVVTKGLEGNVADCTPS